MGTTARVNGSSPRWQELLATFGSPSRPRGGPEGERLWLRPADWCGVQFWMPRAPALVVVCPKTAAVGWWLASGGVPRDVGFVCAGHPSDAFSRRALELVLRGVKRAVFVTDLDPFGLVQYLDFEHGFGRRKTRVSFGGIDGTWLHAMRRAWNGRNDVGAVSIAMDEDERRLLAKLDRAVDLDRLVGPEAAALLRRGHKVEMEGATNPGLYRPSHTRWLFRHLRTAASERLRIG